MSLAASVLIPAHDEADWLPACLTSLLASDPMLGGVEVIVIANGCTDATAEVARGFGARFTQKGWTLHVLDLARGGKLGALNAGEAAATGAALIYVDADVQVSPALIGQIAAALDEDAPRYASGRPRVTVAGNALSRIYTRFWLTTPFMTHGVPGFGVFAMNGAGRARWDEWPDIISDDTFARLNFAPSERIAVPATYDWPMIEGFQPLVQVRRRQNVGVAEIAERYPHLLVNDDSPRSIPLWRRALRDPVAFATYCVVRIAVQLPVLRSGSRWARGR
jgi:glycosyltransferase involved in cell wall biosynthesis